MKISLKWLNEYIDVSNFLSSPHELANRLTHAGLEVEEIQSRRKDYENVLVGEILQKERHPDADRLTVCQVTTGVGIVHQIVCGAKNHNVGDRVALALPGAVLPGNFTIKNSRIRGVDSGGMLCSEKELGLADESEGIIILDRKMALGQPLAEAMGLDDVTFELKVTPNRSDCLSHYGLAREISCLLGVALRTSFRPAKTSNLSTREKMGLDVREVRHCPRYAGAFVSGVKIGESPEWLRSRLNSIGMKSINNVVDVTNFVMMELGQPLHAFDAAFLKDSKIIVELSKNQEKFVTLDGTELTLTGEELVIRDGAKPVALAGVIGSLNSGVREETVDLFIESAYFLPSTVRRTSRKFGIETDSAYRFARGVDPEGVLRALDRACELICEVAGGEIFKDPYDVYPSPFVQEKIVISLSFVEERLGYKIEEELFTTWMKRMGCKVHQDVGSQLFEVVPPPYRVDLALAEDLVEEFGRLNGYENIPEVLPESKGEPQRDQLTFLLEGEVSRLAREMGYAQAINYSFVSATMHEPILQSKESLKRAGLGWEASHPIALRNPLNEDLTEMRLSLLPGLIHNVVHNFRHGNLCGRLFEVGLVVDKPEDQGDYRHFRRLALIAWGNEVGLWSSQGEVPLVFDVKTALGDILKSMGGARLQWNKEGVAPSFLHPGQWSHLKYENRNIGILGKLHPEFSERLKIKTECVVAEINLDLLFVGMPRAVKAAPIGKFPGVERDIAFVVPNTISAGMVQEAIQKAGGKLLRRVDIFDTFKSDDLGNDRRSLAYRLFYQDFEKTMTEDQISALQKEVIDRVCQKFSIAVR